MSAVFVTGGTGYLGAYVLTELLARSDQHLLVLTRGDDATAARKLWAALQFHLDDDAYLRAVRRITLVRGDLHAPGVGLSEAGHDRVMSEATSVLHLAASLNRKSATTCFNSNLRGTLHVVQLARQLADAGRLQRFTEVSTSAVAGKRQSEVVLEDDAIGWQRSDYDPYARTKKFTEYMVEQLLDGVSQLVLRPSTVMGDSRFGGRCWQNDMTQTTCSMADMPVIPIDPDHRLDFVTADFVCEAIARLHLKDDPQHRIYHLTAGLSSTTGRRLASAMDAAGDGPLRFAPRLSTSFELAARVMNRLPRRTGLKGVGAVLKVFWPYITFDTVLDNTRVTTELDLHPGPWEHVLPGMKRYCDSVSHRNPVREPTPAAAVTVL